MASPWRGLRQAHPDGSRRPHAVNNYGVPSRGARRERNAPCVICADCHGVPAGRERSCRTHPASPPAQGDCKSLREVCRRLCLLFDSRVTVFAFRSPELPDDTDALLALLLRFPRLGTLRIEAPVPEPETRTVLLLALMHPGVKSVVRGEVWWVNAATPAAVFKNGVSLLPRLCVSVHSLLLCGVPGPEPGPTLPELQAALTGLRDMLRLGGVTDCLLQLAVAKEAVAGETYLRAAALLRSGDALLRELLEEIAAAATALRVVLSDEDGFPDFVEAFLSACPPGLGPRCVTVEFGAMSDFQWDPEWSPVSAEAHDRIAAAALGGGAAVTTLELGVNSAFDGSVLPQCYLERLAGLTGLQHLVVSYFDHDDDDGEEGATIERALDAVPPGAALQRLTIYDPAFESCTPASVLEHPLVEAHARAGTFCVGAFGEGVVSDSEDWLQDNLLNFEETLWAVLELGGPVLLLRTAASFSGPQLQDVSLRRLIFQRIRDGPALAEVVISVNDDRSVRTPHDFVMERMFPKTRDLCARRGIRIGFEKLEASCGV